MHTGKIFLTLQVPFLSLALLKVLFSFSKFGHYKNLETTKISRVKHSLSDLKYNLAFWLKALAQKALEISKLNIILEVLSKTLMTHVLQNDLVSFKNLICSIWTFETVFIHKMEAHYSRVGKLFRICILYI